MSASEFTDDEFGILELVAEDGYAFRELMLTPEGKPNPELAGSILLSFLADDFVEIFERDDCGRSRSLARDEARAAITDPANWTDPLNPPAPIVLWHEAFATPAGRMAYERAHRERHP
jgi:hypothetical protein